MRHPGGAHAVRREEAGNGRVLPAVKVGGTPEAPTAACALTAGGASSAPSTARAATARAAKFDHAKTLAIAAAPSATINVWRLTRSTKAVDLCAWSPRGVRQGLVAGSFSCQTAFSGPLRAV